MNLQSEKKDEKNLSRLSPVIILQNYSSSVTKMKLYHLLKNNTVKEFLYINYMLSLAAS